MSLTYKKISVFRSRSWVSESKSVTPLITIDHLHNPMIFSVDDCDEPFIDISISSTVFLRHLLIMETIPNAFQYCYKIQARKNDDVVVFTVSRMKPNNLKCYLCN